MRAYRILIAGGGTGGHFFPGVAIAQAIQKQNPGCELRFGGAYYGIERRLAPQLGYKIHLAAIRGWAGMGLRRRLTTLCLLPLALLQCLWALVCYRPHLIIGVGGYASAPFVALGLLLRCKVALQEQNAHPGLANRLLGPWAHAAFLPQEEGVASYFRHGVVTGSPVRQDILALRQPNANSPKRAQTPACLLIFGGSQGAHQLNKAVIAALPFLAEWGRPLRIIHQTGAADLALVQAEQAKYPSLQAEALTFIKDMPAMYAKAHLVYARAGASTIHELTCAKRASILTPIPRSSGDHQRKNAQRLAKAGAAVLLEQANLNGQQLAKTIVALFDAPKRLTTMEKRCDTLFYGDAAQHIAKHVLALLDKLL